MNIKRFAFAAGVFAMSLPGVRAAPGNEAYQVIVREYPRLAGELVALSRRCTAERPMVNSAAVGVGVDSFFREFLFRYTRSAEDLEDALRIYRVERSTMVRDLEELSDIEEEVLRMACERLRDDADVFRKRIQLAASEDAPSDEQWGVGVSYWNPDAPEMVLVAQSRIDARKKTEEEATRTQKREKQEEREEHQKQAVNALASMVGLMQQKVARNWIKPPGVAEGLDVLISVRVTRTGEVISAEVARSSGSQRFDDSARRAVLKASPLPFPTDLTYYEFISNFNLLFKPQG